MKPNDRISKQEQLEFLQEDVQQTGTCPACWTVPVPGTQVNMWNLIVFHVACGRSQISGHRADAVAQLWNKGIAEGGAE